jgi:serine protease Do
MRLDRPVMAGRSPKKRLCLLASLAILSAGALLAVNLSPAFASALNRPEAPGADYFFSNHGYLGVILTDVDPDKISTLRLKDNHGAEVVLVDHDAPAGQSGLKVHDVILQLDGQPVETADHLRRRLHEIPPGRTIGLLISREGNLVNVSVKLCDQDVLKQEAWKEHAAAPEPPPMSKSFVSSSVPRGPGSNFLGNVLPRSLNIGADVNPVRPQLADYFGVSSGTGLLVESVDAPSPASRAGLKAGDVVVKVESQPVTSKNDWAKILRSHRGRPVQLTIMRNKQEMVLVMSTGKSKAE